MHVPRRVEVRVVHYLAHGGVLRRVRRQEDGHGIDAADGESWSAIVERRSDVDDAGSILADRNGGESVALTWRHRDLRQQLTGPSRSHVDAEEELVGGHRTLACLSDDGHRRADSDE